MKYVSTRGHAPCLEFEDVLLAGLARDGGLYVPESWPHFSADQIRAMQGQPYTEVAYQVMAPFVGSSIGEAEFRSLIEEAYGSFNHKAVAPLVQVDPSLWLLELFHGPTLAFKDFAMQILGRLMDRALINRGERATILGATSGDTGGAAIEAFRGRDSIDIFILHPHGRVSDVQRRQMTTAREANVFNIALDGNFDDCQAVVKALFNDLEFRDGQKVTGVNSINWARIMAQIVYYFTAAAALGSPERALSFSVPTGNFGDVFAGFVAKQMGLPIERLVVATNVNDILVRTLETGVYQPDGVSATYSPSMDIQVSSNFERLLFEMTGRDAARVSGLMDDLSANGKFELSENELAPMRALFSGVRVDEDETFATISACSEKSDYTIDPHSAIGLTAAMRERTTSVPMVALATAHPAKFPDVVTKATGFEVAQPARLQAQLHDEERVERLPNDLDVVKEYIRQHSRAGAPRTAAL
ncbi:MAG: threonine synthase [Rhodomicrobium sp.]|nr:MAG: threonine synthase [Rhodomicrobium sp.]